MIFAFTPHLNRAVDDFDPRACQSLCSGTGAIQENRFETLVDKSSGKTADHHAYADSPNLHWCIYVHLLTLSCAGLTWWLEIASARSIDSAPAP
jgi:hypothetical protein